MSDLRLVTASPMRRNVRALESSFSHDRRQSVVVHTGGGEQQAPIDRASLTNEERSFDDRRRIVYTLYVGPNVGRGRLNELSRATVCRVVKYKPRSFAARGISRVRCENSEPAADQWHRMCPREDGRTSPKTASRGLEIAHRRASIVPIDVIERCSLRSEVGDTRVVPP